jgi:hypothetical protein
VVEDVQGGRIEGHDRLREWLLGSAIVWLHSFEPSARESAYRFPSGDGT